MSQEDGFECNGVSNMLNHSFVSCNSTCNGRNRLEGCDVEIGCSCTWWTQRRRVVMQSAA